MHSRMAVNLHAAALGGRSLGLLTRALLGGCPLGLRALVLAPRRLLRQASPYPVGRRPQHKRAAHACSRRSVCV